MFKTRKPTKWRIVAAAAAAAALAGPALASAEQWTIDGVTTFAGVAKATGQFEFTLPGGVRTTCDVQASIDLANPGGVAQGEVTSVAFGAPAGGSCATTAFGCHVDQMAAFDIALPWAVTTSGTSVTITNLAYYFRYRPNAGACSINPDVFRSWGSIDGSMAADRMTFENSGPLNTAVGSWTIGAVASVNADLALADANSNPVSLF